MQKITPFLWFDHNLEDVFNFYTSVFKGAKIVSIHRVGGPNGKVITGTIDIEGQLLHALNGGPMFKLTEAFSLMVNCETQEEVDNYWEKLSAGGERSRCGWLKDKFGLSWQVIPTALGKLLGDPDPETAQRVMNAMLNMEKIVIKDLEKAHRNE